MSIGIFSSITSNFQDSVEKDSEFWLTALRYVFELL